MNLDSYAKIDLRFDQRTDFTHEGLMISSFDAVKPMVDRIKLLGYSGVELQTNVPINVSTGKVDVVDETAPPGNQDKSLPDDFWRIANYASDLGLDVAVRVDPVDYVNDAILNEWYDFGPDFTEREFFNSLRTYETALAVEAEKAGVDLFYIGVLQGGFDGSAQLSQWQSVIDSIRSVYSGQLAYVSHYHAYCPVWDLVDVVGVLFDPLLSKEPTHDLKDIVNKYNHIDNAIGGLTDVVMAIRDIRAATDKPIVLVDVRFDAGNDALGNYNDFFSMALNQQITDQIPNTELQTLRIHGFFEMIKSSLGGVISGVQLREYMPQMQIR